MKYTGEEIEKMTMLEIQEKLKVCPICWSKTHLCGECEQYDSLQEYEGF